MPFNQELFDKVVNLASGGHKSYEDGMCFLEACAYVAGKAITDRPPCVDKTLGHFGRGWNDRIDDTELRTKYLRPLIPHLLDTAESGINELDVKLHIVREYLKRILPILLEAGQTYYDGLPAEAQATIITAENLRLRRLKQCDVDFIAPWVDQKGINDAQDADSTAYTELYSIIHCSTYPDLVTYTRGMDRQRQAAEAFWLSYKAQHVSALDMFTLNVQWPVDRKHPLNLGLLSIVAKTLRALGDTADSRRISIAVNSSAAALLTLGRRFHGVENIGREDYKLRAAVASVLSGTHASSNIANPLTEAGQTWFYSSLTQAAISCIPAEALPPVLDAVLSEESAIFIEVCDRLKRSRKRLEEMTERAKTRAAEVEAQAKLAEAVEQPAPEAPPSDS